MSLILLAEDDRRLANLVKDYLGNHGFDVVIEEAGHNVARSVQSLQPALVILDINLPGKDGLSVCKDIRPKFNGPILMLTARDTDADQILGLEYGADDYVIKPAEPPVLLARIRALLRRYNQEISKPQDEYTFGELTIHMAARQVFIGGEEIKLSSHEFELLCTFAAQPGKVLSREYLFNIIYSRPYDGMDRTIDVRISQLRKKVGDASDNPTKIKTVWGRGYLFVADAW